MYIESSKNQSHKAFRIAADKIIKIDAQIVKKKNLALHSQLRLAIISMLVASDKVEFTHIQSETKAAAGNISIQIKKLEDAGYIKVEKTFKNNYPNTILSITDQGIKAFESYVSNLKKYINPRKQFLS